MVDVIRKLAISVRGGVMHMLAILFDTFVIVLTKRSVAKKNNVLIVRADQIGDFVLWLPAAQDLRKLFPPEKYHVTLVANAVWAGLAKDQGIFDEVWAIDMRDFASNLRYRFRALRQVRTAGFSIAIQPTYSREVLCGDSLMRASGALGRIGLIGDCTNTSAWMMRVADRWYTQLVPTTRQPLMELERNAEFVRRLGGTSVVRMPAIGITRSDVPSALHGVPYFVLFPGANWPEKRWPAERFVEIAARIVGRCGWTGVICGGRDDAAVAGTIGVAASVPLIDLAGSTTLQELAAIFSHARLVLTNDTSAAHIAAAVGARTVCILGGGHYGRFLPYAITGTSSGPHVVSHRMDCFGCDWQCIYQVSSGSPYPCVNGVTTDAVWEEVLSVVEGEKGGENVSRETVIEIANRRE